MILLPMLCNEPGEPNGVPTIAARKSRIASGGIPAQFRFSDFIRRADDSDQSREPKGCYLTSAVRDALSAGTARYDAYGI